MLTSILHRVSGDGLALVGLAVLLWWLCALASGPEAYDSFGQWMWADIGALEWGGVGAIAVSLAKLALKLTTIGLSWAFFNHLVSGLRHLVLDVGGGFELGANRFWSIASPVFGLALTVAFWAAILYL